MGELEPLLEALREDTSLTSLEVVAHGLQRDNLEELLAALDGNKTLTSLSLAHNLIDSDPHGLLQRLKSGKPPVRLLDLTGNPCVARMSSTGRERLVAEFERSNIQLEV